MLWNMAFSKLMLLKWKILHQYKEEIYLYNEAFSEDIYSRFDREQRPIPMGEWLILLEHSEYYTVAKDELEEATIITTWTGSGEFNFQTLVQKDQQILVAALSKDEKEATHFHNELTFWVDQKVCKDLSTDR
jgi:hypothetical protein